MTPTDPNERARELKPCPFCGSAEHEARPVYAPSLGEGDGQ